MNGNRYLKFIGLLFLLLFLQACPPAPEDIVGQMVEIDGFKIDATEVTRRQYREFLRADVPLTTDDDCAWNLSRQPDCNWQADMIFDLPANCINWCNARDYCNWKEKRLCMGDLKAPETDEWYIACSGKETFAYPYGNEYDPSRCNGWDYGTEGPEPAATLPDCKGAYDKLYDMSGNLIEWTGICQGLGEKGFCRLRGGGYANEKDVLRCDFDFGKENLRAMSNELIGFRCCKDLD